MKKIRYVGGKENYKRWCRGELTYEELLEIDGKRTHMKNEVEYCENCGEIILDLSHECGGRIEGSEEDKNFTDRLNYGFDLFELGD